MTEILIKKNIIDMEYQQLLSYFEIVSISIISAGVGLVVAWLAQQIALYSMVAGTAVLTALFFSINGLILYAIRKKKTQLLRLRI